ncbi:unnamed protein product [Arctogadus glacialis]
MVSHRDQILFIIFLLPLNSVLGKPEEYHAVGSNVTLQTRHGGNKLTSIDWKHGENIAVKWVEQKTEAYRNFEDGIFLNLTNGDLTLIGVTESESGNYTVALNGKDCDTELNIKVIRELMRFCRYTCAGDTSQSEPVSYEWRLPNRTLLLASNKTINVTMSLTGLRDELFCTMKNPLGTATTTPTSTAPPSPLAERTCYFVPTVILAVILVVILVVIFAVICVHRHMTGVWIWKKEIWEKRKDERNGSSKDGTKYGCPKPLLNQTENNVEITQDEDTAV